MNRIITSLVAILVVGCSDGSFSDQAVAASTEAIAGETTYAVTIENLTAGQPLTPPVIATHRKPTDLFDVGSPASEGILQIAENGNLEPLLDVLQQDKHVDQVVVAVAGDPPPVLPGESVTIEISGQRGAKYLSYASMLICTNDGFTGVDGLRLPKRVGDVVELASDGYDAGTEINTEDFADMVPPCPVLTGVASDDPGTGMSDPALAENDVIRHHDGIRGIADLDVAIHDWTGPVTRITIERIR